MTKNKRFNFNLTVGEDEHKGLIFSDGKIMKTIDVVHLLNKFQQEVNNSVKLATENVELEEVNRELNEENEQLKQKISELKCLLELAKLHTEVAEGKMDKFVELKFND